MNKAYIHEFFKNVKIIEYLYLSSHSFEIMLIYLWYRKWQQMENFSIISKKKSQLGKNTGHML